MNIETQGDQDERIGGGYIDYTGCRFSFLAFQLDI